jgi:hypothetical protein
MELILTEICDYLNNNFWEKKIEGSFSIVDGYINVPALKNGQYFRIIGSTFNDGVHKYPITATTKLTDEEFKGVILAMAVPATVIAIASDITEWQAKYGGASSEAMSPFNSESFDGYSYSKSGSGNANSGSNVTWQDVFGGRLNKYRKLRGAR